MEIRQVEAELFQSERRADKHEEANGRFSKFCRGVQKSYILHAVFLFRTSFAASSKSFTAEFDLFNCYKSDGCVLCELRNNPVHIITK
jgi:hypothetical protein